MQVLECINGMNFIVMQGCGSAWTHVAACCNAGSNDHDQSYVCPGGEWDSGKDYRAWDWFNGSATGISFVESCEALVTTQHLHTNLNAF